jgi:hydroxyethylthiazole kinase-like uncharacterized protein yjeF
MLLANTRQIREADRIQIEDLGFPGVILMENAARAATERLLALCPEQHNFLVLAGPGNNGGDGLVMARYLHLAGKQVEVILSHPGEKYQGDAAINYHLLQRLPVPVWEYEQEKALQAAAGRPMLIDALLGTGIRSELRGIIHSMISLFRMFELPCAAVDLPSGLNADTGEALNEVIAATHTFTFQLPKVCHYVQPAAALCGEVHPLDIGIWPQVIEKLEIRREVVTQAFVEAHYRPRKPGGHKGSYGHLLLVGGSRPMAGAIAMTALSAVHSGVGLCTVFCPAACRPVVNTLCPEAMCIAQPDDVLVGDDIGAFEKALAGKSVVALGPGMDQQAETLAFLKQALPLIQVPLVLDADGLNLLAAHPDLMAHLPETVIFTPHPGELSRFALEADPKKQRLEAAEAFARQSGKVVVLKGANTLIAAPDGRTFVNTSGNPGLGSGGTGDVLTGAIAAWLAQGYAPEIAAALGVFFHGQAADRIARERGPEAVTATEVARRMGK